MTVATLISDTGRPDLTDQQVDAICDGLTQNAAKVRYLRGLGLRVDRRPNGRPLVARADWERVYSKRQQADEAPDGARDADLPANGPRWRTAMPA
ncbi:hypothetical protein [Pseudorhodoferax soli]|uniref:DUF4224 domain-containing protein n=1 Tax=Pseudorhodoferax soli TaxID=545864 RepID=A0A368Y3G5_9BURK|nr:hypothetical protein [Pseudorhodoferax soli]RCW73848.1 hypothetical protein DES41_102162 [Pseudorhodoferax soli]